MTALPAPPAPLPPARLSAPAKAAWHRIYDALAGRGEWLDLYRGQLEMTASHCALYLLVARQRHADPIQVEEVRLNARRGLAQMLYLPAERVTLATLTPEGIDAEISAVCAPLNHTEN